MARLRLVPGLVLVSGLALGGLAAAQPNDPIGDILQKTPPEKAAPAAPKPKVEPAAPAASGAAPAAPATAKPAVPKPATTTTAAAKPAEVKVEPPKRPRYPVAILQALDKVTAESIRFEAPVGKPVKYHNLVFTVRSCETTTDDEKDRDAIAFVEVDSRTPTGAARDTVAVKSVFKGWFFASSPSVNPLQHPVYDAWLIACKA